MNWIDSHRGVDEGVTVGNYRTNRLLFCGRIDTACVDLLTGSSAHTWSVFCCVQPSRNENQH